MKTEKCKSLWVGGVTFVLTALVTTLREFEPGNVTAVWVIWAGFSWSYVAYAYKKTMRPWPFVVIKVGEREQGRRIFWFWFTTIIYLCFLAVAAFSDK